MVGSETDGVGGRTESTPLLTWFRVSGANPLSKGQPFKMFHVSVSFIASRMYLGVHMEIVECVNMDACVHSTFLSAEEPARKRGQTTPSPGNAAGKGLLGLLAGE